MFLRDCGRAGNAGFNGMWGRMESCAAVVNRRGRLTIGVQLYKLPYSGRKPALQVLVGDQGQEF